MAHYNFKNDLVEGNKGENVVIEHLKKLGGTLVSTNNDNRYDALINRNGGGIKYEIKTDVLCKPSYDTGNIYVEIECRGKCSGIMVTEAKWFVTYFKHLNEIWYIKSLDMINLINVNEKNLFKKENSGDHNSNTKGWLIPKWKFYKEFLVFDSITYEKIYIE